jgi:hypothetical protein
MREKMPLANCDAVDEAQTKDGRHERAERQVTPTFAQKSLREFSHVLPAIIIHTMQIPDLGST